MKHLNSFIAFAALLFFCQNGLAAISVGGRVSVTQNGVNVRASAGSMTVNGQQNSGALGTVTGGPTNAQIGGTGTTYTWWNVNFDSGADGWVASIYLAEVAAPTMGLGSPNAGATWQTGTSQTVSWSVTGDTVPISYFVVRLSTNNGSSYTDISSNLSASARSFSYTPNSGQATTTAVCWVRAFNSGGTVLAGAISSGAFTIANPPPTMTLSSPNAGATWQTGTSQTVNWTSSGDTTQISYFVVRLSTNNGSSYTDISSNLSSSARSFSYTPTSGQATTTAVCWVRAFNSGGTFLAGAISSGAFTIATPALSITTTAFDPATATVGTGYSAQQAVAATGGQTPYSWSATGLPNGMAINSSTGAPFGTPDVSGTFNVTVTVTDSSSPQKTASKVLSLSVLSALSITTTAFDPATATVGTGYAAQQAVAATGGQTPYSWSATGLPNGMGINSSTGAPFGTPTVSGTFNVTVTVTDSSSPQKTASKVLSLSVQPATSALSITTTAFNPATATVGTGYSAQQAVTAAGGQTPYSWSATGLPNGMGINSSTGAPFGTPTVSGTFNVTVTAADSSSPQKTASKVLPIIVSATNVPGSFTLSNDVPYWDANPPPAPAVRLNWTPSSNVASYEVYRDGAKIYPTSGTFNGTSFLNILGLTGGQTYNYYIVAKNSYGPRQSNSVAITMPTAPQSLPFPVTGLTIAGPTSMSAGGAAQFTCAISYSNGNSLDVTATTRWSILSGFPPGVAVGGYGLVQISTSAPAGTFTVRAEYETPEGQLSDQFSAAVGGAFAVRASHSLQSTGGNNYSVQLSATPIGASGIVTYRWDTNSDGVYGDLLGANASWTLNSQGGRHDVRVEATDSASRRAYALRSVLIDKPPVANQPGKLAPVSTGSGHSLLDAAGQLFQFDPARISVGLIVITHDLEETGAEEWAQGVATAIEQRLPTGAKPNILIYDWREDNDPTRIDLTWLEVANDSVEILNAHTAAEQWVKRKFGLVGSAAGKWGFFTKLFGTAVTTATEAAQHLDFLAAPVVAYEHGLILKNRLLIESQAFPPRVDFTKPIHFIGKGTGGNLVAQAALSLKWEGKNIDRVTLLDTTMPDPVYYKELPNPTVVEHITSSYKGDMEWPQTWLIPSGTYLQRDIIMDNLPEYFGSVFLDLLGGLPIVGALAQEFAGLPEAHDLAPWWYRNTAVPTSGLEVRGFYNSPFLNGPTANNSSAFSSGRLSLNFMLPPGDGYVSNFVTGFSSFGAVSEAGSVYTITESSDAGIFQTLVVPVDVEKLRFKFRFTGASDGDILAVRFGARKECFAVGDLTSTHGTFALAEISMGSYAGMTDQLVFTLVSRGEAGATVELKEIEIVQNDDVDGDGLTTSQEVAAGANPQTPDTDSDGWIDTYEVNISHTNPALGDTDGDGVSDPIEAIAGTDPNVNSSTFAIKETTRAADGSITLRWSGEAGKTYRVQMSSSPGFGSFETIGTKLIGVSPLTTFTVPNSTVTGMSSAFFRAEVE